MGIAKGVPYILIVGCAGLCTCTFVALAALASEIIFGRDFGLPDPPIFGIFLILVSAIGANICYTGGWIVELCVAKLWPREADKFATRSFLLGLVLSVLLTLVPCVLVAGFGIFGLVHHLRHTS